MPVYIIIERDTSAELGVEISTLLEQGWTAQGGVSVVGAGIVHGKHTFKFYQAMIKTVIVIN